MVDREEDRQRLSRQPCRRRDLPHRNRAPEKAAASANARGAQAGGLDLNLVEVFIATWFTAGLALHPDQLGSATARTITDIASMWGPILTVADIMVAVPILLAANDGRFPRWLGILAAVFAVEQLIETITIIGPPASFISPGGAMNFYLGGPLFIIFFLALGVALSLEQPAQDEQ